MLGALASSVSLLGLALADPFSIAFAGVFNIDSDHQGLRTTLFQIFAFAWIWLLSVSVQPLQAASRAIVVESCPDHQQAQAAAWVGRATAGSNVVGYALGALPFADLLYTRRWKSFQLLYLFEMYVKVEDERPGVLRSLRHPEAMEDSRRYASLGVFCFAVVSLLANLAFPFLARSRNYDLMADPHHVANNKLKRSHDASLLTFWAFGHLAFAASTLATFFAQTSTQGFILISSLGIPWALTNWIPHAIVGREVTKRDGSAAILTGVHNSFISAPQILSALICSIMLAVNKKFVDGNGVVLLLRMSGFLSLVAASLTLRLRYVVQYGERAV
ncbi:General alpha-glucoside permease [Colletotrichum higginsianum IMI 349063]|uniref:General alpha-glucoside permease n=1 Tax=Colletotrichum higginsianum (strain IMI 349063) TaxID=759273 RepID=A0A1B7Y035_COLHI|nr:General alpha-glucoside permease [Colletotrichum higginsianum IMI 349063]OBR05359.1 General alpha-glucoside permease [Colletotrichum higginsianum IMI 349063]